MRRSANGFGQFLGQQAKEVSSIALQSSALAGLAYGVNRLSAGRVRAPFAPSAAYYSESDQLAEFRKRLSASHKRNISRAKRRNRRNVKQQPTVRTSRLASAERASKVVRNLSLAAETPSKIARNMAYTKRAIGSTPRGIDRGLSRAYRVRRLF